MKPAKKSATLGLAILTASASPWGLALDEGWYLGASVGQSMATIDDARIRSGLAAGGLTTTGVTEDDTDTGFKVFGAYQFNQYLAVEGGYFDLGQFGYRATTVPPGTLTGELTVKGFNVDAVGYWAFTEKFFGLGRIGMNYADVRDQFRGTGAASVLQTNPEEKGVSYKFGLGLEYDFTESLGARIEGERYRIDDAVGNMSDIDLYSLGIVFRFGGARDKDEDATETRAAALPAAKRPEPALVVVPATAGADQYCSILDLTFDIDNDEIQREDKEKLAVVGRFMTKYPDTTAVIEGHSDNVGSPRHNLDLSQARAESVVIACATDIEGLPVATARTTLAVEMQFDVNKADIKPEYTEELRKVAAFLKANPKVKVTVEGHTGNLRGAPEQVMAISQLRAQNVVDYLVQKLAVPASQLAAQGFGKTRLFAYNTTAEGRQENRRVNIVFTYAK